MDYSHSFYIINPPNLINNAGVRADTVDGIIRSLINFSFFEWLSHWERKFTNVTISRHGVGVLNGLHGWYLYTYVNEM